MIKQIIAVCILSVAVVSCKKEAAVSDVKPVNDSIVKSEVREDQYKPVDTACSPSRKTEDYITALQWYQAKVEKDLTAGTPEQNDKTYEDFVKIREKYTECLTTLHSDILDKYVNYYNSDKDRYDLPDNVKKVAAELKKAGLEFREVGEGITEIWSVPGYYLPVFKGKVTPDYEAYITQIAKENESNYAADAGLIITWEELGERLIFWENFINKYPKSKLLKTVREDYHNYLYDYLFGMDNTMTYESADGKLYDENIKEFNRIIKKYPNSNTAKKARELMTLFEAQMPADQIREKINIERQY